MVDEVTGCLRKMRVEATSPVGYRMPVGDTLLAMNEQIGSVLELRHTGNIHCIECGRKTGKSFSQGYCYPCFKSLAECDLCIMKPETCHFAQGTCRDEEWAKSHCMQDHYVYLANSSGLKVGITRGTQIPTRWIDQGASQAIAMFRVSNRFHSGLLEVTLKKQVSDRTDWRRLLKGPPQERDMVMERDRLAGSVQSELEALKLIHADLQWELLDDAPIQLTWPVERYPERIVSLSLDKTPEISGALMGIKGQYLILDCGVINIRKFAGYEVTVRCPH